MDIGAVGVGTNVPVPIASPLPTTVTRDFAALVLESMLRQAGVSLVGAGTDAATGGLVNDLVIQVLAQQLAADFNLAGSLPGANS